MTNTEVKEEKDREVVSLNKLLEAGVYFGHKKDKWNPKMKPFIHGVKNGTHVIDVSKTHKALELAFRLLSKAAEKGATFIFVGTKKQAKDVIKEQALRTNSAYVNERWLGGTLTNSKTIFSRLRVMEDLEELEKRGFEGYTKKEGILLKKELEKLHRNLNGIRPLQRAPQFMIVADPNEDLIAIKEAKKRNVKVIGIIDTNTDPELVDLGIPANDDSIKSLNLIITILGDAIVYGKGGQTKYAYQPDESIVLPQEEHRNPSIVRKTYGENKVRRFTKKIELEQTQKEINKGE
ncbi:30S ribosomal protein S2 [Mesomycoplasma moatsii]|uniref:30S ribosomal protein S2 n=1 Tax=Mesomycoplasma moatsii TaxID=171287 RepID=UPI0003B347F3